LAGNGFGAGGVGGWGGQYWGSWMTRLRFLLALLLPLEQQVEGVSQY